MSEDVIATLNAIASRDKRVLTLDPPFLLHGLPLTSTPDMDTETPPVPLRTDIPPPISPIMDLPLPPTPELWDIPQQSPGAPIRAEGLTIAPPPAAPRGEDRRIADYREPQADRETTQPDEDGVQSEEPRLSLSAGAPIAAAEKTPKQRTAAKPKDQAPPHSRPVRITKKPERFNVLHMTAKKAINEDPKRYLPPILQELTNLVRKGTFHGRHWDSMTQEEKRSVIRSSMNVTTKVTPASEGGGRAFDKDKGRLVFDGSQQDHNQYTAEEISAPTASTTAVLMVAQLAAAERRVIITVDIVCAYLNAEMPKGDGDKRVLMLINPQLAALLYDINPEMAEFKRKDGSVVVELDRALYGCIQSAQLWHQDLSSTLIAAGFTPNPSDVCIFNRTVLGRQTTVVVYVDDLLITAKKQSDADSVIAVLEEKYKELKIHRGLSHNYLGMVLDFATPGVVKVNQIGMVEDIIKTAPLSAAAPTLGDPTHAAPRQPTTPAAQYLFDITPDLEAASAALRKAAHSTIAKILFIAGRGRPDLLTLVALLTKRVKAPTQEDLNKLARGIQYMEATKTDTLTLGCTLPPTVRTYVDASFAVHPDKKSHTGACITLGRGMFFCKSTAQKINTTSSCESELVALAKGLRQGLWSATFLENQGYPRQPVTVLQDNTSTIKLIEKGRSTSELTRHIEIGYYWVHDLLKRDLVSIEHCPTKEMVADFFTKPLQGSTYKYIRAMVMGDTPCVPNTPTGHTRATQVK